MDTAFFRVFFSPRPGLDGGFDDDVEDDDFEDELEMIDGDLFKELNEGFGDGLEGLGLPPEVVVAFGLDGCEAFIGEARPRLAPGFAKGFGKGFADGFEVAFEMVAGSVSIS